VNVAQPQKGEIDYYRISCKNCDSYVGYVVPPIGNRTEEVKSETRILDYPFDFETYQSE